MKWTNSTPPVDGVHDDFLLTFFEKKKAAEAP